MPSGPDGSNVGTTDDGVRGLTRVYILAETAEAARGLAELLAEEERLEIAGWEATQASEIDIEHNGRDSFDLDSRPDVVLLYGDVTLTELPLSNVPVVVLSADGAEQVLGAWEHRGPVRGWLSMQASAAEIVAAISSAAQGLTVLTPAQVEIVFQSPAPPPVAPVGRVPMLVDKLTPRELQVLRMVAEGLGNKEIAGQLGISDHTAKFHVASILAKLRAQTRTEAVALGIRLGLVPI